MSGLIESGMAADIILAVIAVEFLVLLMLRGKVHALRIPDIVGMLVPGLFLVLALRSALTGASWQSIAVWLMGALVAHLFDVWRRINNKNL
jgi:hypothetical protein